jgi:AcrR family transcriptional regulator
LREARYHHGDLREALEREAKRLLEETGAEGLSLRKLAERVGVSPPALYHHFRDKNALLCAIAEQGFESLERDVTGVTDGHEGSPEERLRIFVRAYMRFALRSPETYDLMFGRTIWKNGEPTAPLREIAHAAFRRYAARVIAIAQEARLAEEGAGLRLAQASWAMLHGLCRLHIDGVYVDASDLDAMGEEAVRLVLARLRVR